MRRTLLAAPLLTTGCYSGECTAPAETLALPLAGVERVDLDAGTCAPILPPVVNGGVCARRATPDCVIVVGDAGPVALVHYDEYQYYCGYQECTGRKPEGLEVPVSEARNRGAGESVLGDHFARMAHLEAASVIAFERLAGELHAHGAPPSLPAAARRAARDERRHARATAALARKYGREAPAVAVSPLSPRTLLVVAIENAVEGCVGESFGAAVALFQSRRAQDPAIREIMRAIARDERAHAALAWSIHDWAASRLSAEDRARVVAARDEAAAALERGANIEPPPALGHSAGLPTSADVRALLAIARETLWS